AATYILKAIDFENGNSEYWFTLGEVYEELKMPLDAIKCYRHVCRLDPQDREAWIRTAKLYIDGSQLSDALEVLREAYLNNFASQDILFLLAAVYFRLKDEATGARFFEKALSLGEGGSRLFFEVYPEGKHHDKIKTLMHKD
ncbi:MAG: tetratricopeptide repeat protein, partial [Bacteroidota bacterium]